MAFHPYPQVIPQVFNPGGFGPPRGLTRASTCPWVDHSASGLQHATQIALFRLAFATATPHGLTLPHTVTRRLILQKARGHFTSARRLKTLPRLVGTRFQVLFHDPSPGHFSPFPHGTCSLSVTREYLGLGGGPPRFTRDFTGPVLLGNMSGSRKSFAYGGVTLYADAFHTSSATQAISYSLPDQQSRLDSPATPVTQRLLAITRNRFGLFPFRSPLLRESRLLSLPVGTEMFHFPTLPPPALCVQAGAMGHYAQSGFPIRKSPDRSLVTDSPGLIAGSYVLHRLLVPRHPPCALINLATTDDARVHCAVLKIRAVPARRAAVARRIRSWLSSGRLAAVPSGPNSVLGPRDPLADVPSRTARSCLSGSTRAY